MDVTSVFKDCLSHNQKSLKDLDSILNAENGKHGPPRATGRNISHKSTVFPGKKSEHFTKAKEISTNITKLRDFLKECRTPYVNVGASKHASANSAVFSSSGGGKSDMYMIMSDKERDQIDSDVQLIIQNCQKAIRDFQLRIDTSDSIRSLDQLSTHLENMINSVANYLKRVTEIYSEMRAIRVKRTVDYQAMSKLASQPTSSRGLKNSKSNMRESTDKINSKRNFGKWDTSSSQAHKSSLEAAETEGVKSVTGSNNVADIDASIPSYFLEDEDAMSPEELQVLEQENAALLNELNTLSHEVEQIESNVVEIAQLQEIFTEKVLQQERDIDRIGTVFVNTTENIRGGNEQVRQAIQNSADFRAWVLFFIMVMSFSLLFLDWYND